MNTSASCPHRVVLAVLSLWLCAAPAGGPEHAHQLRNTGTSTLKYVGVSTQVGTEVVEYPDSNKFAVISRFDWNNPEAGGIRYVGRKENSLDYFDGEDQ